MKMIDYSAFATTVEARGMPKSYMHWQEYGFPLEPRRRPFPLCSDSMCNWCAAVFRHWRRFYGGNKQYPTREVKAEAQRRAAQ